MFYRVRFESNYIHDDDTVKDDDVMDAIRHSVHFFGDCTVNIHSDTCVVIYEKANHTKHETLIITGKFTKKMLDEIKQFKGYA